MHVYVPAFVTAAANLGPAATFIPKNDLFIVIVLRGVDALAYLLTLQDG